MSLGVPSMVNIAQLEDNLPPFLPHACQSQLICDEIGTGEEGGTPCSGNRMPQKHDHLLSPTACHPRQHCAAVGGRMVMSSKITTSQSLNCEHYLPWQRRFVGGVQLSYRREVVHPGLFG